MRKRKRGEVRVQTSVRAVSSEVQALVAGDGMSSVARGAMMTRPAYEKMTTTSTAPTNQHLVQPTIAHRPLHVAQFIQCHINITITQSLYYLCNTTPSPALIAPKGFLQS